MKLGPWISDSIQRLRPASHCRYSVATRHQIPATTTLSANLKCSKSTLQSHILHSWPAELAKRFLYQIFMPSIYSHINATYLHYLVLVPGSQTIIITYSIRPFSPKNKTLQSGLPKEEFQKKLTFVKGW